MSQRLRLACNRHGAFDPYCGACLEKEFGAAVRAAQKIEEVILKRAKESLERLFPGVKVDVPIKGGVPFFALIISDEAKRP